MQGGGTNKGFPWVFKIMQKGGGVLGNMGSTKGKTINQIKGLHYYCKSKFYLNAKKKNSNGSRETHHGKDFCCI